jgi:peptidoglycan LD-endopeptidase LytH
VKKLLALLGVALIGALAWIAAGPDKAAEVPVRRDVPGAMGAPAPASAASTSVGDPDLSGEPLDAPPNEPPSMRDADAPRALIVPVAGVARSAIRDMFNETRGNRRHEAIDILAPTGTPVIATDDGVVKKLFTSKPGGLTVYQFDPDQRFCYYYAHLDRYAPGLHEGQLLRRGEVLGYVGTTGNAPKNTPHLHFALIRLDKDRRWWKGTYVNPYPSLAGR